MADWVLIFQAFVSPTVYATPVVIQGFENKTLCEQAAETIAGSMRLKDFDCIKIVKKTEHYE